MRAFLALALFLALVAGCITPDPQQQPSGTPPPPTADRVEGMTADVQKVDRVVDCGSGTSVPPQFCAERNLTVTGRVGVDHLDVDLVSVNGGTVVRAGEGDAWSFKALVRVAAPTQDMANQGLDTAWTWSHEQDGKHAVRAGPTTSAAGASLPVSLPGGAQVSSTRYELTLPAWVTLDTVGVRGDNGGILVAGFRAGKVDLSNTNGGLGFTGSAADVTLDTTNGGVQLDATPTATGAMSAKSTNGAIVATLHLPRDGALDAEGKSTNGAVTFHATGGSMSQDERTHKRFRSDGFDGAAVQTTLKLETTNGAIVLTAN
ncbi:MAG: hypothetical protein QOE90_946 [Thermoplasmata archaeon]|jgi:hypothetical protein|nr:hypothetical protein [Thermoplasmata archaeon]